MHLLPLPMIYLLPVISANTFFIPHVILQAGYPRGFRAYVPDFPGMQYFSFHGQLNPLNGPPQFLRREVPAPINGYWIYQDDNCHLRTNDVVSYWTYIVKDRVPHKSPNMTWTVPEPDKFVDLKAPLPAITTTTTTEAAPTEGKDDPQIQQRSEFAPPDITSETPQQKKRTETTPSEQQRETTPSEQQRETTPSEQQRETTPSEQKSETPSTTPKPESTQSEPKVQTTPSGPNNDTTPAEPKSESTPSERKEDKTPKTEAPSVEPKTENTPSTTPSTTTPASPETSSVLSSTTSEPTQSSSESTSPETTSNNPVTTTTKPPVLEKRSDTPSNSTLSDELEPPKENSTESTTPTMYIPVSELPEEPSNNKEFQPLFPGPFKPMMPPKGPSFEICSNPWNFVPKENESKTQKLEKQVAKLQCELAMFQRKFMQLGQIMENELTDIKKLNYGMVGRMSRLEALMRATSWS